MEQANLPVVAKKIWNTVRVMFYMLKKGILKKKFMIDLNAMITRGKIVGKAIHNLMFHHAHHNIPHLFGGHVSRKQKQHPLFSQCAHPPDTDDDMTIITNADGNVLEMVNNCNVPPESPAIWHSAVSSPTMLGFGWSTAKARQVRITDSPFPMSVVDEDRHVDEAAADFISKFYDRMKRENNMSFG